MKLTYISNLKVSYKNSPKPILAQKSPGNPQNILNLGQIGKTLTPHPHKNIAQTIGKTNLKPQQTQLTYEFQEHGTPKQYPPLAPLPLITHWPSPLPSNPPQCKFFRF